MAVKFCGGITTPCCHASLDQFGKSAETKLKWGRSIPEHHGDKWAQHKKYNWMGKSKKTPYFILINKNISYVQ